MADTFKFDLVSPERLLISEEATAVVIPGADGEMTVMAHHAPVMTTIQPGVVTVTPASGSQQKFVVFGGFADILGESCTLLAESAINVDDIERGDLDQRIQDAREDVADAKSDDERTRAETYLSQLTTLQAAIAA